MIGKFPCILLFIAFLVLGCGKPSDNLADYSSVTVHFSGQEEADLQTLLHLFEEEIGVQSGASVKAKSEAYTMFNKQLVDFMMLEGPKSFPLSIQARTKLLDALHIGTFRSIWVTGISTSRDTCDCKLISSLTTNSKFIDFLADMGKEFPQLAELHTDLQRAGDMTPAYISTVFLNFEQLNTQDPRTQLVYVISCLSWGMKWE